MDTHVSKHLFEECIQRFLAGKTRILATHQLQYIKGADGILLCERGKMRVFSNYRDLLAEHPDYSVLLASEGTSETADDSSFEKSEKMRRHFSTVSMRVRNPRRTIHIHRTAMFLFSHPSFFSMHQIYLCFRILEQDFGCKWC